LARCSGIATRARRYHQIKEQYGFKGRIAGTRKTTPGFRLVEKYGLLIGFADSHRMDLSSTTMLKDNHIALLKHQSELPSVIQRISQLAGFTQLIEVECTTEEQAEQCIKGGAKIIMLDNLMPENLKKVAKKVKLKYPHVIIEASGGISEENLSAYFCPDVDIISCGSLTQGVPHIDFSLKITPSTPFYFS
jgi:nicotinate-nucleotide pyrophosphorylase (carboxylating)